MKNKIIAVVSVILLAVGTTGVVKTSAANPSGDCLHESTRQVGAGGASHYQTQHYKDGMCCVIDVTVQQVGEICNTCNAVVRTYTACTEVHLNCGLGTVSYQH